MSKNNNERHKETVVDKLASKKAMVLGTDKKSKLPLVFLFAGVAIAAAAGIFFMHRASKEAPAVTVPVSSGVPADRIRHPASLFDDGKARHFQYEAGNGITIKYFVLKSSDEVIRAAFDACDVCWPAGKGYYQDGDYMVCRNCGRRFASVLVNEVQGGCNPAPLNRSITDGVLTIMVDDILQGRQYFDFSGRS